MFRKIGKIISRNNKIIRSTYSTNANYISSEFLKENNNKEKGIINTLIKEETDISLLLLKS